LVSIFGGWFWSGVLLSLFIVARFCAPWHSGFVTDDNERGSPGRLWHCVLVVIFWSAAFAGGSRGS